MNKLPDFTAHCDITTDFTNIVDTTEVIKQYAENPFYGSDAEETELVQMLYKSTFVLDKINEFIIDPDAKKHPIMKNVVENCYMIVELSISVLEERLYKII